MFLPYILALFTFIIYFSLGFLYCDTRESLRRRDRFSMREHTQQRINNFWRPCALSLSLSLSSVFFLLLLFLFLFILFYLYFIHPSLLPFYFLLLPSFRLAHLIVCALLFDLLGLWPNQLTLTIQYVVVVVVVVSACTEWNKRPPWPHLLTIRRRRRRRRTQTRYYYYC